MTDAPILSAVSTTMDTKDEDLDALVQQASRPTLASLFEQGKQAGLIKPVAEY